MFRNHLKLAYRNLLKSKYTSAINLTGLVVGMTAALLLWQYVAFEKSYDSFNENADHIVRVRTDRVKNGEVFMQFSAGAACAGPVLHKNFEEVEDYMKMHIGGPGVYAHGDRFFQEEKANFASANFFQFFSLPLLQGNEEECLAKPFTACISESAAKKYFGTADPIGKMLKRNGRDEWEITGVFADWPANSHLKPNILLSYITYSDVYNEGGQSESAPYWDGFFTYLMLKPGTELDALEAKIPAVMEKTYDKEAAESVVFSLLPMRDIHLQSDYLFEAETNGDAAAVGTLLIIGLLVLLIAWFNYVNLSTARAETRARKVGVRKVIGSSRGELIRQFMLEAALLNFLAVAISVGLAQILAPGFEQMAGKPIPFTILSDPKIWLGILGVFLVGTLLAGMYPAIVLSGFWPSEALSGKKSGQGKGQGGWFRKGLVVAQFATSMALIVGTIVIFQQLSHMRHTDLGVNIDQTLVIEAPSVTDSTFQNKFEVFKKESLNFSAIKGITGSTDVPGKQVDWTAGISLWGSTEDGDFEGLQAIAVDADFATEYELDPIAGRLFSTDLITDTATCILNESGVKRLKLGTPEEALGTDLNFWGDKLTVVGVVKNYHQRSPKAEFEPLIFRTMRPGWTPDFVSVKTTSSDIQNTLTFLEKKWAAFFPGNPFEYFFLDEKFARQYEADERLGRLTGLFAGLAIFVSCLGLFALAAFVAERRTKEIGIRKVLGASVENLVGLLSKEFLILVGLAILIATPLSWFAMENWLQGFHLRIDLEWWYFALAGAAAVAIAFVTMSFQSIKAALMNPVDSLRSE